MNRFFRFGKVLVAAVAGISALSMSSGLSTVDASETVVGYSVGELNVTGYGNRQLQVDGYAYDSGNLAVTAKVRFLVDGRFYVPRYRNANKYRDLAETMTTMDLASGCRLQ